MMYFKEKIGMQMNYISYRLPASLSALKPHQIRLKQDYCRDLTSAAE